MDLVCGGCTGSAGIPHQSLWESCTTCCSVPLMGSQVVNLFVIVAIGVILADMIKNASGTAALFNGVSSLWTTSVKGMLGQS